jgi:hypothetical protein
MATSANQREDRVSSASSNIVTKTTKTTQTTQPKVTTPSYPTQPLYKYSRDLTPAEIAEMNSRTNNQTPVTPTKANAVSPTFVTATPLTPSVSITVSSPPPPVKTATLDIVLFDDETTPIDTMADLIFENIGGQELINITRSDIVNGQKISYQPIKNLASIQQRYNPNNIISLQQTSDKYFAGFSIKLEDKIPNEGNGINGENIYFNDSGDLIIEFVNINNDEQIEVQITVGGTIYNIDLGENVS